MPALHLLFSLGEKLTEPGELEQVTADVKF